MIVPGSLQKLFTGVMCVCVCGGGGGGGATYPSCFTLPIIKDTHKKIEKIGLKCPGAEMTRVSMRPR